jgi:surface antigen/uncharacterized protein YukE
MAQLGMDVDAVEAAGRQLQAKAQSIDAIVANLDKTVASLNGVWDGKDAQTFIHEWWPDHRKALATVSQSVGGLGQSALNNASEQRKASGSNGGGAGFGAGSGGATLSHNDSTGGRDIVADAPAIAGAYFRAQKMNDWAATAVGRGIDVDHAYGNQCVDVINDYANKIFPGVPHGTSLGGGNAKDIFANSSSTYFDKIPSSGTPEAGDIVCIAGTSDNGYGGHVAVVESVDSNGTVHLIEQDGNHPDGVTYRDTLDASDHAALQGYLRPNDI